MNIFWHGASAIALGVAGYPGAALGAIAPDITWIGNEIRFRRSGKKHWKYWILTVDERDIIPYKLAHSILIVGPVCIAFGWWEFFAGWAIHIVMDLPTHTGRMTQQPFYPIRWKWPWVIK